MKLMPIFAAVALAIPAAAAAQDTSATHKLAWHPAGKTPAAVPHLRAKPNCIQAADHHKGAKGPVTPVIRCNTATEFAQRAPEAAERGE